MEFDLKYGLLNANSTNKYIKRMVKSSRIAKFKSVSFKFSIIFIRNVR